MEYEDMFPFDGIVDSVKHKQAYTKNDIEKINQLANENQLDVMPLLQTYGNRIIHRNLRTGFSL
jgi:hexosaminidase